jgi:hypothetical protein
MPGSSKDVKSHEPHGGESSPMSLLTDWVRQGTESFFATQRILLDLVSRQNSNVIQALRDGIATPRPGAITALTELAGEAMSNFIAAQKVVLNLAQENNEIVLKGVKERVPTPAGALADLMRRSFDTFIEMQKNFLSIAGKESDAWTESAKSGKIHVPNVANIAREGLENFVKTQKTFLEAVAEEVANATKTGSGVPKAKKTALAELAQESTDAFINAQKKLLDLASQQVAVNLKAGGKIVDLAPAFPTATLANLTRDTVETFVAAQRSLLDVVAKPKHATRTTKVERPALHAAARKATRKGNSVSESTHSAPAARAN